MLSATLMVTNELTEPENCHCRCHDAIQAQKSLVMGIEFMLLSCFELREK